MPGKVSKELIPAPATALDQAAPMPSLPKMVDAIKASINKSKDLGAALSMVTRLGDFGKISGVGQAAALHATRAKFRVDGSDTDEQFKQVVFSAIGYAPDTVRRYLLAWDFMEAAHPKLDDKTWEILLNRHVGDLIALGQAYKEHGPFKVADLKKLAKATDSAELRKGLRKTKGEDEAEHPLMIQLSVDGTLTAYQNEEVQIIGALVKPEAGDEGIGAKAIARLIKRGKIMEQ